MPDTGVLQSAASDGSHAHPAAAGAPVLRLLLAGAGLLAALALATPALAGPVVCTTTLEAVTPARVARPGRQSIESVVIATRSLHSCQIFTRQRPGWSGSATRP